MKQKTIAAGVILLLVVAAAPAASSFLATLANPFVAENVTYATDSGVAVTVEGQYNVSSGNPFADAKTLDLVTESGNVTVSGNGSANLTLTQLVGTETVVKDLGVATTGVTINPEDKQAVTVKGDTSTLRFRSMAVDDGDVDFVYAGASGTTTLTVTDLPADHGIIAVDIGTGETLDKAVTDASGTATFDEMPNSEHTVKLQSEPAEGPTLDNADPTGTQSTTPNQLSIDVNDSDFPDDEVNVTMWLDGTEVKNTTLTSNSTVTYSLGSISPGEHTWNVSATDSFGQTATGNFSFGTPANLSIYNASAPDNLINDRTVNVTIYTDGDTVFQKSTTDGNVSLEGLPTSTDLVVEAEANGYLTRSIIVEDIAQQHSVFLLNESVATNEVRFQIDDATGKFSGEDVQVIVEKPINQSGSTNYKVVSAGEVGVNGFTTKLEDGARFRISVKNTNDDTRTLGAYTSAVAETVVLKIGSLSFESGDVERGIRWNARYLNQSGNPKIVWNFSDVEDQTTRVTLTICERDNCANNTIADKVYTGEFGNLSYSEPLTAAQDNKTWVVKWTAERNGRTIKGQRVVGKRVDLGIPLADLWKQVVGVGMIIFVGGVVGGARPGIGAVVVAAVGGIMWFIGFLPPAVGGGAVALAFGVGVAVNLRRGI